MIKLRLILLYAIASALLLSGCVMRPERSTAPVGEEPSPTAGPTVPPEIITHTVEFRHNGNVLSAQTLEDGAVPQVPAEVEGLRLLGWTDETGQRVDPAVPVTEDRVFQADTRPLLKGCTDWLLPRANGFLMPEDSFTHGDALAALDILLADGSALDSLTAGWAADEDAAAAPLSREEFTALLYALFDVPDCDSVLADAFPAPEATVTRARAAFCLSRLTDAEPRPEFYYPDAAPDRWAYDELSAAALPGTLDRQELIEKTLDDFLWFDGYLYRLDEEGWFLTDMEYDGLYYGPDGRYTSGNRELDEYVAKSVILYTLSSQTRLEKLKSLYVHVKNDFKYLVRNYYDNGSHGWEIPEALTLYKTGMGNCYCYAGVFWSLARGVGYNATAYSGTMGNQNQPHAWTEITLDGRVYICDPEIEMNYWWLANVNHDNTMFTDNFMMPREQSGAWNYLSIGRE